MNKNIPEAILGCEVNTEMNISIKEDIFIFQPAHHHLSVFPPILACKLRRKARSNEVNTVWAILVGHSGLVQRRSS